MLHRLRSHRYGIGRGLLALVVLAWTALAYLPCAYAMERKAEQAATAHQHQASGHSCSLTAQESQQKAPAVPSHLLGCDDGRCLVMSSVESAPLVGADHGVWLQLAPVPLMTAAIATLPVAPEIEGGPPPQLERIPPSPILAFRVLRI